MGVWDNYQCKHYDHALHPTDAWPEIGKILWYSFKGHYKPPRDYFFVAPRGTGTTLSQLLANSTALKAELIKVWNKACRDTITNADSIPLSGHFAAYVDQFDFSIFKAKPVREISNNIKIHSILLLVSEAAFPHDRNRALHPKKSTPRRVAMSPNCWPPTRIIQRSRSLIYQH